MANAMIYSESERAAEVFCSILKETDFAEITVKDTVSFCGTGTDVSLHLINSSENFDCAARLAEKLSGVTSAAVMLLADQEKLDSHAARLRDMGVMVLAKPLSRQLFIQALEDAVSMCGRIRRMGVQLDEMRRISRAKLILVEKQHMTEQQAHKFIEKEAMNRRITRLQLADELIENNAN